MWLGSVEHSQKLCFHVVSMKDCLCKTQQDIILAKHHQQMSAQLQASLRIREPDCSPGSATSDSAPMHSL